MDIVAQLYRFGDDGAIEAAIDDETSVVPKLHGGIGSSSRLVGSRVLRGMLAPGE